MIELHLQTWVIIKTPIMFQVLQLDCMGMESSALILSNIVIAGTVLQRDQATTKASEVKASVSCTSVDLWYAIEASLV